MRGTRQRGQYSQMLDRNNNTVQHARDSRQERIPGADGHHLNYADHAAERARGQRPVKKKGSWLGVAMMAVLVVVAMLGVGAGIAYWYFLSENSVAPGEVRTLTLEQGTSVAGIADQLEQADLIDRAIKFRIQVRLAEADDQLLAGTYRLAPGMTYEELIATLIEGPPPLDVVTVTIPEGRSIDRMAEILAEAMNFSAEEFTLIAQSAAPEFAGDFPMLIGAFDDTLEGYLFPDTYEFLADATPREVITVMLNRFVDVWDDLGAPTGPAADMTASEIVVIASLVEMESSLENERPLVSSVIYNRLDIGRKLQFCSTVQYTIVGEERQRLRLTYEQTQVPSPYNTYLIEGLPPGPISNPGRQALDGALHPADTSYIYFVLTGQDGSQTFASNTAEFEEARQLSREVFGQ